MHPCCLGGQLGAGLKALGNNLEKTVEKSTKSIEHELLPALSQMVGGAPKADSAAQPAGRRASGT